MQARVSNLAWLSKEWLGQTKTDDLKERLMVQPTGSSRHKEEAPPFPVFVETEEELGVPREFFLSRYNERMPYRVEVTEGTPIEATFASNPAYDEKFAEIVAEQAKAIGALRASYDKGELGGILQAGCGFGKTACGIKFICNVKRKTLVIVHKEFLMRQWKERIAQFIPTAKVGFIQQDRCEVEGMDIVIAMVHTLALRSYSEDVYSAFGLVIVDECHRMSAPFFSGAIPKFKARYRLGLSATPRRKDGTERVFLWTIGPVRYKATGKRLTPTIKKVFTGVKIPKTPSFDPSKAASSTLLNILAGVRKRNELIGRYVAEAARAGRKILVLSHRIEQLKRIEAMYRMHRGEQTHTVGYYVGALPRENDARKRPKQLTEEELEEAAECQIIMATYLMVSEGYDDDRIDTLFLATPISDVEQTVGRVVRESSFKKPPVVVDFVDEGVQWAMDCWIRRLSYYKYIAAKIGT